MKQPKKLTRNQKMKLSKKGYDAEKYMFLSEDNYSFTVISKSSDDKGIKEEITFNK